MIFCNTCKNKFSYSEKWDSYFCDNCNYWEEEPCEDEHCPFDCCHRPDTPYPKDVKPVRIEL